MKFGETNILSYEEAFKLKSKDIVLVLLEKLLELFKQKSGYVGLFDGKRFRILSSKNFDVTLGKSTQYYYNDTPLPKLIKSKNPVIFTKPDDVSKYPVFKELSAKTYIGFPIFSMDDDLVGIVELYGDNVQFDLIKEAQPLLLRLVYEFEIEMMNLRLLKIKEKVDNIVEKDHLTGVFKKNMLQDRLEREFAKAKQFGRPLSCIMIDISNFEILFFKYGPEFADYILKEVSDNLKKSLRDTDYIFRFDGNKFFVILPETKMEDSFILAERLRYKIENTNYKINQPGGGGEDFSEKVVLHIGLSAYPNNKVSSASELIQISDRFLHESKKTQQDKVIN